MRMVVILGAGDWRLEAGEKWIATEAQRHRGGNWSNGDTPIPGVCVRVARKGLTRQGVRKSGKQRSYKEAFLRFGATDEFPKGYPHPGCFAKRGWICLIPKELTFLGPTKRLQAEGSKGDRGSKGGALSEICSR